MIKTFISNIFDGDSKAYIYIWYSKKHKVVYIGMTNSHTGVLGRATDHFKVDGTLRNSFLEKKGYEIKNTTDLILLSFLLPQKNEYISIETSYREGIEYLIQKKLIVLRSGMHPRFKILSSVRYNDRANEKEVQSIANTIIENFKKIYSEN